MRRASLVVPIVIEGDAIYVPEGGEWQIEGGTAEQGQRAMHALVALIAGRTGRRGA